MRRDPRLETAGFSFLKDEEGGGRARFVIERDSGTGKGSLGPGPLFSVEASVDTPGPFVHEVAIEKVKTDSTRRVWPGTDVIAVVPQ